MIGAASQPRSSRVALVVLATVCAIGLLVAGSYGRTSVPATRPISPVPASSPFEPALIGNWAIAGRPGGVIVTLNTDGTWVGFDGCNQRRGNWLVLDEGLFAASATRPERGGCSADELGEMLTAATRVDVAGGRLLLSDGAGRRWELRRSSAAPLATVTPPGAAVGATTRIDVGVACPEANSILCGRVGIAVWPTGPVDSLRAQIGSYSAPLHRTGEFYSGFVMVDDLRAEPFAIEASAAGQWLGDPPTTVDVHVTGSADGAPIDVTLRTDVGPGWG